MARRCISNAFSPSPEKDVEFPGPANDVGVIRIELQGALEVIGRAVELVRNSCVIRLREPAIRWHLARTRHRSPPPAPLPWTKLPRRRRGEN